MKSRCLLLSVLLAAGLTSCKEDPELVRKRDDQQAEITRLKGEVALLDEKLKEPVPDRTKDLAKAKEQIETQTAEIARIEKEIASLEAKKAAAEKDFADYRQKYTLKNN